MKTEALERLLVSTLRTQLAAHKIACGQTSEWIYVDYPRTDAKMPRISITLTSSAQRPAGIGANVVTSGTFGIMEDTSFDIDIWIHRTNKTTGITPQRGGTSLRDWLGDEIVAVLLKQRATLKTSDEILDIIIIGQSPQSYDEETELFQKTISISVTHVRKY